MLRSVHNISFFNSFVLILRSNRATGFLSPDHCRTPVLSKPEESLYSDVQVMIVMVCFIVDVAKSSSFRIRRLVFFPFSFLYPNYCISIILIVFVH